MRSRARRAARPRTIGRLPLPAALARAHARGIITGRTIVRHGVPLSLGDCKATLQAVQQNGFDDNVLYWKSYFQQYGGDIPVDFLLAWITCESDGDPCSYTSAGESGIFQLDPSNMITAGTTAAKLRAACSGSSQTPTRALTSDEEIEQVTSGIRYVNWARAQAHAKLSAAGQDWDESSPDFWRMVKFQHAYPAYTTPWLNAFAQQYGRPAATWDEFRSAAPAGYDGVLDNAEWVGSFGGGPSAAISLLVLGGLAYAAWWLTKKVA